MKIGVQYENESKRLYSFVELQNWVIEKDLSKIFIAIDL